MNGDADAGPIGGFSYLTRGLQDPSIAMSLMLSAPFFNRSCPRDRLIQRSAEWMDGLTKRRRWAVECEARIWGYLDSGLGTTGSSMCVPPGRAVCKRMEISPLAGFWFLVSPEPGSLFGSECPEDCLGRGACRFS